MIINHQTINELIQSLDEHLPIVLYGAGANGKVLCKVLEQNNLSIAAFVNSDGCHINDKESYKDGRYFNKPFFYLSQLPLEITNCHVIITIFGGNNMVEKSLEQLGCHHVHRIESRVYSECYQILLQKLLVKKGVDLSFKHIEIALGQCHLKLLNPFCANHDYAAVFLTEAKDLLFPLLGDDDLMTEGLYEHDKITVKQQDIVIDCGANIGLFSSYAASKGAKVYAFEPCSETVNYLHDNARLYPNQIIIEEKAVSHQTGNIPFYLSPRSSGEHSLLTLKQDDYQQIFVKTITIDDYVQSKKLNRVDFIKADIEGAERMMLKGARETLRKYAPKLSICTYHLPDDAQVLKEIILEANPNYKIHYKWKKLFAYVE